MNKTKAIVIGIVLILILAIAITISKPKSEQNSLTNDSGGTIISPSVIDHEYQFNSDVKEEPVIKSIEDRVIETYGSLEELASFKYQTLYNFYGDPNFERNRYLIGESIPKGLEIMNIDNDIIKVDEHDKPIVLILTNHEHSYIKNSNNINSFVELVSLSKEFGEFDVVIVNMYDDGNAEFINEIPIGYAPTLWTPNIKDFMEQLKEPVVIMINNNEIEFATALMSAQATSGVATAIFSSDIKTRDILSIMDDYKNEVISYSPVSSTQKREEIKKVSEAESVLGYKINLPKINSYTTGKMEIIGDNVFSVEYIGELDTLTYRVSKDSNIDGDYRVVSWASDIHDDARRYEAYGANKNEIFKASYYSNSLNYSLVSSDTITVDFIKEFFSNIK